MLEMNKIVERRRIYEDITRKSNVIIHSSDEYDNKMKDREYWLNHNEYVRPLLIGSDAHNLEEIGRNLVGLKVTCHLQD